MPGSFPQQSRQRKLIYFGVILLLFSAIVVLRKGYMDPKAVDLKLREESLGEVKLTASAVQRMLTGSRGLVVCYLWYTAQDKQAKHEWNELELLVDSITNLQPHFITPWLFQSWNLAYNVSVESDRVKDKFFFVTRGVALLGEGERRNRDHPDMRHYLGWYYQNKFGMADEANTFRSLFQLACIDPKKRHPDRFREPGSAVVNLGEFEQFCKEQPHLVRRLRERLRCDTPDRVVEFLADNRRIPSRYKDIDNLVEAGPRQSEYKPYEERFPLFPPESTFDPSELTNESEFPYDVDNFDAARAWFKYSQDPVDILKRRPRYLGTIIFQSQPARAQAYKAEHLEKNGWFDREGWEIRGWFPRDKNNPAGPKISVFVGDRRDWGHDAWTEAWHLYNRHGEAHGLLQLDPEQLAQLDAERRRDYDYGRQVTNFEHFYQKARTEQKKEVVDARKSMYRAEELRRRIQWPQAVAMYEDPSVFGPPSSWAKPKSGWKKILAENPEFHSDQEEQKEIFEAQVKYMRLQEELYGVPSQVTFKRLLVLQDYLAQAALRAPGATVYLPPAQLMRPLAVPIMWPLDGVDEKGQPWISGTVVQQILGSQVRNVSMQSPTEPAANPAAGAGP